MYSQRWLTLIAIQLGGALCVPLIEAGFTMGARVGFLPACAIIAMVNIFGSYIGMLSALFGFQYRSNTAEAAEKFLGPLGGSLVAVSFFFAGAGWYAIHSATAIGRISLFLPAVPVSFLIAAASIIILAVAWQGIQSIGMLAQFATPLYLFSMGMLYVKSPSLPYLPGGYQGTLLSVAAFSAALLIGTVANFPTFFQNAKTARDARVGGFLVPLVVLLPIQCLGAYLGAAYQGGSFLERVTAGLSQESTAILMAFIILSSWTALNNALYSGGVSLAALSSKISQKMGFFAVALTGSLLALSVEPSSFCFIIELIGVPLVPVGALVVYSMLSFMNSSIPLLPQRYAQVVVIGSSLITVFSYITRLSITGEPFLDGALVTALGLFLVGKMAKL